MVHWLVVLDCLQVGVYGVEKREVTRFMVIVTCLKCGNQWQYDGVCRKCKCQKEEYIIMNHNIFDSIEY